MHALDELWVSCGSIVHLALSHVISRDEESCLGIVLIKNIKNVLRINIRAIIKGQSYVAFVCAEISTCPSIADIP